MIGMYNILSYNTFCDFTPTMNIGLRVSVGMAAKEALSAFCSKPVAPPPFSRFLILI